MVFTASITGLVNSAIKIAYSAKTPTTSPTYIFSYLRFRETMINPPTIKQPSWKYGKLVVPAAAYSAKLKVAVKRITAAAAIIVPNVFFMIGYLLEGNLFYLPLY